MVVDAKKTEYISVEVDPEDAVKGLLEHFGMTNNDTWCFGNILGYSEDVSYHGSPIYEHYGREITPFEVDVYKTLKHLQDLVLKRKYHPEEAAYQSSKGGYLKLSYGEYERLQEEAKKQTDK